MSMANLAVRSILVLALLFGLLFGVGMAAITLLHLPMVFAFFWAITVVLLQYLLGPILLEWIYSIRWVEINEFPPVVSQFIVDACQENGLKVPRLGIIEDGNPNAFTYGHHAGNARLVVTRGVLNLLTPEEVTAVVGHELGHIKHQDFIVMTIAAVVPLLLYILYRTLIQSSSDRKKGGGGALLVALISWLAYVISQFIVLFLSRVREYYADQFSARSTRKPHLLASGLVKIAYGLAAERHAHAPPEQSRSEAERGRMFIAAARSFGIFDPKAAQAMALQSAGAGSFSIPNMQEAMKWDLWNPWALVFELSSSHPLPARRIQFLEKEAEAAYARGDTAEDFPYHFREKAPESYWDEFLVDLGVSFLPLLLFLAGIALAIPPFLANIKALGTAWSWAFLGFPLLGACAGSLFLTLFSYPGGEFKKRAVSSLVGEVKVSGVRGIPATLKGTIIGRGVPGLFWSEDLVLQDETGFITIDYRQPLGLWEFLFGVLKAGDLVGSRVEVTGWYRRPYAPVLEAREILLEGGKRTRCYLYPFKFWGSLLGVAAGILLILL